MRGLWGFLSREPSLVSVDSCLLVATADPVLSRKVLEWVQTRFPIAKIRVVAPSAYRAGFPSVLDFLPNEEVKKKPFRYTFLLRKQRFPVVVFIAGGSSTFRLPKIWSLFLCAGSIIVYNEHLDSFPLHRSGWKAIYRHCAWRMTPWSFLLAHLISWLLWPVGFFVLLLRTGWLVLHRQVRTSTLGSRHATS